MTPEQIDTDQIQFLNKLVASDDQIIGPAYYNMDAENKNRTLKLLLKYYTCEVQFRKVDGSIRTMPCTLREDKLPVTDVIKESKETKPTKKQNTDVLVVYCLDLQEWRSFRLDNVISVKIINYSAN